MTYFDLILISWFVVFPLCLWFPGRENYHWYRRLRGGVWVRMHGYWNRVQRASDNEMVLGLPLLKHLEHEDHRRKK